MPPLRLEPRPARQRGGRPQPAILARELPNLPPGIAEPQRPHAKLRATQHTIPWRAMTNIDPQELVSRYVAVWNQPDAELRRRAIHDLWAEDGAHILGPPQEIRKAATGLGFPSTTLEARGHDEL